MFATPRVRVHRDEVTRPDNVGDHYDWVEVPDQVRVAALVDDRLLLVDQYHYLVGRTLQLPGGNVDQGEDPDHAARRELAEETGYGGGIWAEHGRFHPLPGLSPAATHLWSARALAAGDPARESAETDLTVIRLPLADAVQAVGDGRVGCAASAALILIVGCKVDRRRAT